MMIKMFIWQSFLKPHQSRAQKDSRTEDGAKPIIAPWVKKCAQGCPYPPQTFAVGGSGAGRRRGRAKERMRKAKESGELDAIYKKIWMKKLKMMM
jgi:hypothetical protein